MTTESNVTKSNPRARAYFDVFVTAIEGGINYWAEVNEYHWRTSATITVTRAGQSVPKKVEHDDIFGFYAVVTDADEPVDGEPKQWRIDRGTIEKGIMLLWEYAVETGRLNDYHFKAIAMLKHGRFANLDFDSETADMIVLMGLFGEVVYG